MSFARDRVVEHRANDVRERIGKIRRLFYSSAAPLPKASEKAGEGAVMLSRLARGRAGEILVDRARGE